jgi:hypothetical protein
MPELSHFEQFAHEILECIAFHTATEGNFVLGPPKHLVPLLCTSRTINGILSFKYNSRLYADIFRVKFDYEAPTRRLGIGQLTTPRLSAELRKRFVALKHIKYVCEDSDHLDDLWTAFFLMSESDGRNEAHLIEWARIEAYLVSFLLSQTSESSWASFTQNGGAALVVWLLWMTSSRGMCWLLIFEVILIFFKH